MIFLARIHNHAAWDLEDEMTDRKPVREKDRIKDRSDIGRVEQAIDKLMEFRHASASCVLIEASMEADRGLVNLPRKRQGK